MHYQPYIRPGFLLDPIPEPRVRVQRLMQATALIVEGLVEVQPGRVDPRLEHCLYLPQAGMIVAGTSCRRPLLLREALDLSAASSLSVLVVRGEEDVTQATFDLKLVDIDRLFCAYRMWMPRPSEAAWLVPTAGEERYVRITPLGFEVTEKAPYADGSERHIGLVRAAEFLSVATHGWF